MKIWKIISNSNNPSITMNSDDLEKFASIINGNKLIDIWNPVKVVVNNKKFTKGEEGFFNFLPQSPVVNESIISLLHPFSKNEVEFLPLLHENRNLFLCNITNLIDCVDKEMSITHYSKSGKFIMYKKISFKRNFFIDNNVYLFKIPELADMWFFASDEFKILIENSGLIGPKFELVWDSEIDEETELHQQQIYNEYIHSINNSLNLSMSWEEAMNHINQNEAVVSDRWQLKLDQDRNILLGQLNMDLQYDFVSPKYIPPILLDLKWKKA